jgi:hypothetical protein
MKSKLRVELSDAECDQIHRCEHEPESWKSLGVYKGDECRECGAKTFLCHGCSDPECPPIFHQGKICNL